MDIFKEQYLRKLSNGLTTEPVCFLHITEIKVGAGYRGGRGRKDRQQVGGDVPHTSDFNSALFAGSTNGKHMNLYRNEVNYCLVRLRLGIWRTTTSSGEQLIRTSL